MATEGGCGHRSPGTVSCPTRIWALKNLYAVFSKEALLIYSVQHADSQSQQAIDDGHRWSRCPGIFKPVVEEAISYHGDWGEGGGGGAVFC